MTGGATLERLEVMTVEWLADLCVVDLVEENIDDARRVLEELEQPE